MPLHFQEIRRGARAVWKHGAAGEQFATPITGVCTDSRSARPGELFVAIRGERLDGHAYLAQAAAAGCLAALVARDAVGDEAAALFPGGLAVVDDTTLALGHLAGFYRDLTSAAVLAVTGSNGKTTTKRLIHHILSKRLKGSCSPKSFNNNIGVPLTLLAAGAADDYVVCEVGTNAPGEIAALGAIARPDIAIITSVGQTHLEKLGTVQRVAAEKACLLGSLREGGLGIVWADSEPLARVLRQYTCKMVRFGTGSDADLCMTAYETAGHGCRFQINRRLWVSLPLAGRHNASNALAAIAAAQRMGFTQEESAAALADFAGNDMRLEWLELGTIKVINDAYNANPSSMRAAADVLADFDAGGGRRVMIAGDMRELGEQSPALHEQLGRELGARRIDLVVGVGELGRNIAAGAAAAGGNAEAFDSVEAAADALGELLRPLDVVLIKGSRAMAMERLLTPLKAACGQGVAR